MRKLLAYQRPTARDINALIDEIAALRITAAGPGVSVSRGPLGTRIQINRKAQADLLWKIWRVKSTVSIDAAGAANDYVAYYTCNPVTLDNTDFNLSNTDPIIYDDSSATAEVIVCNLSERGSSTAPALIVGDLIYGFTTVDDAGQAVNIGWPEAGRQVRWAKTQEAAQGDEYISVKLLKDDLTTEAGSAFDAKILFSDAAVAAGNDANECVPRIVSGAVVPVSKIGGAWYCLLTMFYMPDCA